MPPTVAPGCAGASSTHVHATSEYSLSALAPARWRGTTPTVWSAALARRRVPHVGAGCHQEQGGTHESATKARLGTAHAGARVRPRALASGGYQPGCCPCAIYRRSPAPARARLQGPSLSSG